MLNPNPKSEFGLIHRFGQKVTFDLGTLTPDISFPVCHREMGIQELSSPGCQLSNDAQFIWGHHRISDPKMAESPSLMTSSTKWGRGIGKF